MNNLTKKELETILLGLRMYKQTVINIRESAKHILISKNVTDSLSTTIDQSTKLMEKINKLIGEKK